MILNEKPCHDEKNIILDKSFEFALEIIALWDQSNSKRKSIISNQLLRSGTSIGAQVEEAISAQSLNDFIHMFSLAYKEARKTEYWLKLLAKSKKVSIE